MKYSNIRPVIGIGAIFLFLIGTFTCSESGSSSKGKGSSAVSGHIRIVADKTTQPIAEALEAVFENTYPDATLDIHYGTESESVRQLYKDSARMIILGRPLNAEEKAYFVEQEIPVNEQFIGSDAIVLAVHPSNRVKSLSSEQALSILQGKAQRWSDLSPSGTKDAIRIVFDNANSGTVSYLTAKAGVGQLPPNAFATRDIREAVDYVDSHPTAVAILGWSWMSDTDDPMADSLLNKVQLIALSPEDTLQGQQFFQPYQFDLQNDLYPFKRNLYFIRRESGAGLGTGFTVFTTSEIGQRILFKSGILPYKIPGREIEVNTRPLQIE